MGYAYLYANLSWLVAKESIPPHVLKNLQQSSTSRYNSNIRALQAAITVKAACTVEPCCKSGKTRGKIAIATLIT
jgi:hypothetical protein